MNAIDGFDKQLKHDIRGAQSYLEGEYPITASCSSRRTLWGKGLQAGLVTQDLYDSASKYYGKLWNYAGD